VFNDPKRVERLERLIHEGLNLTTIARRFGCAQRTVAAKARELAEQRERERQQREAEAT
jgi:hypothetical protein